MDREACVCVDGALVINVGANDVLFMSLDATDEAIDMGIDLLLLLLFIIVALAV